MCQVIIHMVFNCNISIATTLTGTLFKAIVKVKETLFFINNFHLEKTVLIIFKGNDCTCTSPSSSLWLTFGKDRHSLLCMLYCLISTQP